MENLGQFVGLVVLLAGGGFLVGLGWHAAEKLVYGDGERGDDEE